MVQTGGFNRDPGRARGGHVGLRRGHRRRARNHSEWILLSSSNIGRIFQAHRQFFDVDQDAFLSLIEYESVEALKAATAIVQELFEYQRLLELTEGDLGFECFNYFMEYDDRGIDINSIPMTGPDLLQYGVRNVRAKTIVPLLEASVSSCRYLTLTCFTRRRTSPTSSTWTQ